MGKLKVTYENVMDCKKCNNSGLIITRRWENEDGYHGGGECECHAQRMALITMDRAGLKSSYAKFRFDNFERKEPFQMEMYNTCHKFLSQEEDGNERKCLYISGQPGVGKTHAGTATCRNLIGRGMTLRYMTHMMLLNEFKTNVNSEEYTDVLSKYADVDVLYIDDFFKPVKNGDGSIKAPTGPDIKHTFELVNRRMVAERLTVITSERSLEEIIDIDEALGGRIKEMSGMFAINIGHKPGRDWRLKK